MPILTNIWFYKKCVSLNLSKNIFIAYSGGIDSSVLLKIANKTLNKKHKIYAINIEYFYQKKTYSLCTYCKYQCLKLKIPLYTFIIYNDFNITSNLEKIFRLQRYKIFLSLIKNGATLLLGHNNNDLIETFLLRLFKGAGLIGLSSIKERITLGNMIIVRPLLRITKKQINLYTQIFNVSYSLDKSNLKNIFDRNYIRNNIIPLIDKKWIYSTNTISRYSYSYYNICKHFYTIIYNKLFLSKGKNIKSLSIAIISSFSLFMRNEVIRLWIKENNHKMITFIYLHKLNYMLYTNTNSTFTLGDSKFNINSFKNTLYITDKNSYANNIIFYNTNFIKLQHQKKNCILFIYDNKINNLLISSYRKKTKKILQIYNIPKFKRDNYFSVIYNNNLDIITGLWLKKTTTINNKNKYCFIRLL